MVIRGSGDGAFQKISVVPAVSFAAHLIHEGCTPPCLRLSSACSAAPPIVSAHQRNRYRRKTIFLRWTFLDERLPKSRLLGNTTVGPEV